MSRPVPVIEARTTTTTEIRVTGFPCCHHDPSPAAAEPPSQTDFARSSDPVPTVYTLSYLPPPDLLSKALDSFYSCSGTLFSLIPRSESFALFRSVYWGSSTRSGGTVAELCALAAVGGHYDNDGCPEVHRNALFATAKVFVHELEDLRQMRVYALFTMFSIMEKRIASWSYVSMGLRIAQRYGLHLKDDPYGVFPLRDRTSWRKNWRTLKFFESWLAGTLGCLPEAPYTDITFEITHCDTTMVMGVDVDVVQTEFGKIGFIMSDIMRSVYSASNCNLRAIEAHMQKLDSWHHELPEYMQLRTLLGSAAGFNTTRSILLVHLTYLGSIILLTRKVVVELMEPMVGNSIVDGSPDDALHFASVCLGAAKHIATIVAMLHSDGAIFRRCWLVINQSFNALTLLLTQLFPQYRHPTETFAFIPHLREAAKLIKVLLFCAHGDRVARGYLHVIEPYAVFFEISGDAELCFVAAELRQACCGRSAEDSPQMERMASYLLDVIRTPFGGQGGIEEGLVVREEENHARFWTERGLDAEAWTQCGLWQERQRLEEIERLFTRSV